MGFKKGTRGNAKGKPKGAQNKIDLKAKEIFVHTLEQQLPNIEQAFKEVYKNDKAKFLELFFKYAQYIIPKKNNQSFSCHILLNYLLCNHEYTIHSFKQT